MTSRTTVSTRRRFFGAAALAIGGVVAVPRAATAATVPTPVAHQVERIEVRSARPYAVVEAAFLAQLGPANVPQLARSAGQGTLPQALAELLAAQPGTSGFVLFFAAPVGLVSTVKGAPRKSTQFLVGNPFVAQQMLVRDVRIAQYFPFRVLISEQDGVAAISYDLPSSQVTWLQDPEITRIARTVDERLAGIVAAAVAD